MVTPAPVPANPMIYHIVSVDRLSSIIRDGHLWCDAEMIRRGDAGTNIGMTHIKQRRRDELTLTSRPCLYVGGCVPFYFCPRSVMLYVIYRATDPDLSYRGGQESVLHLEANMRQAVAWADARGQRWAFTSSNAGSYRFEDYADLARLDELDWAAIQASQWSGEGVPNLWKEAKQAEFLMERSFPWELITRIGVRSPGIGARAMHAMRGASHCPPVEVRRDWYYG